MTDKEMLLESIKDFKKSIFDLAINIITIYVRSLALSMIIWIILSLLITHGLNKIGFVTLIITSIITSTLLSIPLIKILKHGINTLKITKKFIPLLDIYQRFENIPDNLRVHMNTELCKIDSRTDSLKNELNKFIDKDDKE